MSEQKEPKKRAGQKPHVPTKETRDTVSLHAIVGTRHENIASVLQIDVKTLYKYYREELDTARDIANSQVGGSLFNKAIGGDTAAQIFWMKTRAGWREVKEDPTVNAAIEIKIVDA